MYYLPSVSIVAKVLSFYGVIVLLLGCLAQLVPIFTHTIRASISTIPGLLFPLILIVQALPQ